MRYSRFFAASESFDLNVHLSAKFYAFSVRIFILYHCWALNYVITWAAPRFLSFERDAFALCVDKDLFVSSTTCVAYEVLLRSCKLTNQTVLFQHPKAALVDSLWKWWNCFPLFSRSIFSQKKLLVWTMIYFHLWKGSCFKLCFFLSETESS